MQESGTPRTPPSLPPCRGKWLAFCSSYTVSALLVLAWFLEPLMKPLSILIALAAAIGLAFVIDEKAGLLWVIAAAIMAYLSFSDYVLPFMVIDVAFVLIIIILYRRPLPLAMLILPAGHAGIVPPLRIIFAVLSLLGLALEVRRWHAFLVLLYSPLIAAEPGVWGFLAASTVLAAAPVVEGSLYEERCPFRVENGVLAVGASISLASLIIRVAAPHITGKLLYALYSAWALGYILEESALLAPRGLGLALLRNAQSEGP